MNRFSKILISIKIVKHKTETTKKYTVNLYPVVFTESTRQRESQYYINQYRQRILKQILIELKNNLIWLDETL